MTLAGDNEVYELSSEEFRFKEVCLHYKLFMEHHGPNAGMAGNRFLWMSHADAFLMALVVRQI